MRLARVGPRSEDRGRAARASCMRCGCVNGGDTIEIASPVGVVGVGPSVFPCALQLCSVVWSAKNRTSKGLCGRRTRAYPSLASLFTSRTTPSRRAEQTLVRDAREICKLDPSHPHTSLRQGPHQPITSNTTNTHRPQHTPSSRLRSPSRRICPSLTTRLASPPPTLDSWIAPRAALGA